MQEQLEEDMTMILHHMEAKLDDMDEGHDNVDAKLVGVEARLDSTMRTKLNNTGTMFVEDLEARLLDHMQQKLGNMEARQRNSVACANMDRLQTIQNAAGFVAPNFPPNLQALQTEMTDFLKHYGRFCAQRQQ